MTVELTYWPRSCAGCLDSTHPRALAAASCSIHQGGLSGMAGSLNGTSQRWRSARHAHASTGASRGRKPKNHTVKFWPADS